MDKLETSIRELSGNIENLNKTARLRALLPAIEEMQRLGVRQAAIVKRLNDEGLKISESAFRNALFRIRKAQSTDASSSNNQRPIPAENMNISGGATETAQKTEAKTAQVSMQTSEVADVGLPPQSRSMMRAHVANQFVTLADSNALLKGESGTSDKGKIK